MTKNTIGLGCGAAVANLCHQTFTFLPPFSLPYTHYSLIEQSPRLLNETFNWEKDKRFRNYCWWVCDSEDWPVNW